MSIQTILFIVLAAILSLIIAVYQYKKHIKSTPKLGVLFTLLRFFSVFAVLILLINPTIEQVSTYTQKPNLLIVADNSSSIKYANNHTLVNTIVSKIKNNQELNKTFTITTYGFGTNLESLDSLTFTQPQTNITKTLKSLDNIYAKTPSPIILLTDGNQTFGADYQYISLSKNLPVYPVVIGDTLPYLDLAINQLNVNKYAFLDNKFPVEIFINYTGKNPVTTKLTVSQGNTTLFSKQLSFNEQENTSVVKTFLDAKSVGVKTYTVNLQALPNEKNTINNTKQFAVEVINEKSNILIVSDIIHPDLSALKKAIESNKQREVTIKKTAEISESLSNYQLVILYQPTARFNTVFNELKTLNKNYFVITGSQTNWQFLNTIQDYFTKKNTFQTEEYEPSINNLFSAFILNDFTAQGYPPLEDSMGSIEFYSQIQPIFFKKVKNVTLQEPLLTLFGDESTKNIALFGEHIWKWRMQTFLETNSFEDFDVFFGKLIQYASSTQQKSRLSLNYEPFYYENAPIAISASYFDANYVFDKNAKLQITLINSETKKSTQYPLLLQNNSYKVDVSGLSPGTYNFTVTNAAKNVSASGAFSVLDFKVEQQFLNANNTKLLALAVNTSGNVFYPNSIDSLLQHLTAQPQFTPVLKSTKKTVSLIQWEYLLYFIAITLAVEWFLRKYHGLI